MHWQELPIHVIDFEGNTRTGIVEYGVVTVLGGVVQQARTRLCRGREALSAEDTRLHRIAQADVADALPVEDDWGFFSELRRSGYFGAHHAVIENGLLREVWPHAAASPDFLKPNSEVVTWGPWVDSRQLYQRLYPDLEEHKLSSLISFFGLQTRLDLLAKEHAPVMRDQYHCALYDALASALLLLHVGEQEGFEEMSLEWLLAQSAGSAFSKTERQQQSFEW